MIAATHHSQRPLHRVSDESLGQLGMWVFITTELLFFGAVITGYAIYRHAYSQDFIAGSHRLDFILGAINTALLLTSSFAIAAALLAAQLRRKTMTLVALSAAMTLGIAFLIIKSIEYRRELSEGLAPWLSPTQFSASGEPGAHTELFFSFYFAMTGLHALHLLTGIGLVAFIVIQMIRRGVASQLTTLEVAALYWHFVDVVWVFLYPLLYLAGR